MYGEYKIGSIISLSLRNFQTYSSTSFMFHPRLNFIAGPNGAGKSTLANAIAFIFGSTPRIIGKGKEITDFIKFNAVEATIEITLKVEENKIVTIKRTISNFKNGSLWFIDNILSKWSKVSSLYEKLNIDITNICNYLPQEKVSEFSRCSPVELFKTFIDLFSDQKINNIIEKLKKFEISLDDIKSDKNRILSSKQALQKAIDHMSKDMEKIKEKQLCEQRVQLMTDKKNWLNYENEKNDYLRFRKKIEQIKTEKATIKQQNQEIQKKIDKESENAGLKLLEDKKTEIATSNSFLIESEELLYKLKCEKSILEKKHDLNEKKRENQSEKAKEITNQKENQIQKLEGLIIPEKPLPIDYQEKDRLELQILEDRRHIQNLNNRNAAISREIHDFSHERNVLISFELQRLEFIKTYHKDTYQALLWLRNNKHMFRDEIIEPCIISLSLKKQKYVTELEGSLSFYAVTSFIVKDSADFTQFTKILKEEQNLGINVVEYRFTAKAKPYSNEEIKSLGFDGYLIDFIDDKKEILDFLSSSCNLSSIPVTSRRDLDERKILGKYNFHKIAVAGSCIGIKRSIYNPKDYFIIEFRFKRTGIFKQIGTADDIQKIDKKIDRLETERTQNRGSYRGLKEALERNVQKAQTITDQIKIEKTKMFEYERKLELKGRLSEEISLLDEQIEKLNDFSAFDQNKSEINQEIDSIKNQINICFRKIKTHILEEECIFYNLMNEIAEINSQISEYKKKLGNLELAKEFNKLQYEELEKELKAVEEDKEMKKRRIQKLKISLVSFSPEHIAMVGAFADNLDDLEKEIATEYAKIAFINTDEGMLRDYKEKEEQIREFTAQQLLIEQKESVSTADINNMKDDVLSYFSPKIEQIDQNFRKLFSKLGYEGKVVLETKDLKLTKWCINIFVKFRKNENLQQLTSYFQSGGERSVSTIIFLLSLLDITPTPFRLVDEINQGMDAYNERMVHRLLVDLVNEKDTPQFFIITPKLVENLYFSKNMKIHILYAGNFIKIGEKFNKYKEKILSSHKERTR